LTVKLFYYADNQYIINGGRLISAQECQKFDGWRQSVYKR